MTFFLYQLAPPFPLSFGSCLRVSAPTATITATAPATAAEAAHRRLARRLRTATTRETPRAETRAETLITRTEAIPPRPPLLETRTTRTGATRRRPVTRTTRMAEILLRPVRAIRTTRATATRTGAATRARASAGPCWFRTPSTLDFLHFSLVFFYKSWLYRICDIFPSNLLIQLLKFDCHFGFSPPLLSRRAQQPGTLQQKAPPTQPNTLELTRQQRALVAEIGMIKVRGVILASYMDTFQFSKLIRFTHS